jgi:hypothetical protein
MNESAAAEARRVQSGAVKPAAAASAEVLRNLRRVNLVFRAGFSSLMNYVSFNPVIFSA